MQIKNMFEKQIDRDIKGVIKVGQSDEENVYQELDEYVVTKELLKHFRDFFNNYEKGVERVYDVGVAGIHRLFDKLDLIRNANVVIVVAGMEGALASVVGGLVERPVIAVPTSVGYGANFQGLSALLGMLNSCSAGVAVVNIDNGFGAGRMASIINHMR